MLQILKGLKLWWGWTKLQMHFLCIMVATERKRCCNGRRMRTPRNELEQMEQMKGMEQKAI